MNIYIHRGASRFGPYSTAQVEDYLQTGRLLPHDLASLANNPGPLESLEALLQRHSPASLRALQAENPVDTIRRVGLKFIFPTEHIFHTKWYADSRFIYLAIAGLAPFLITQGFVPLEQRYYLVSAFFSLIWAFVLYTSFRTQQTEAKDAAFAYLFTAFIAMALFPFLVRWPGAKFFYGLLSVIQDGQQIDKSPNGPLGELLCGYIFGVGVHEEFTKAIIIFFLVKRPGKIAMPQTIVFYGLMSGLGFGIKEGVDYISMYLDSAFGQIISVIDALVHSKIDEAGCREAIATIIRGNFLGNLLRLTALPLFHAALTGIASYFIAFAALNPRAKWGLWVLAILVPAVLHGLFDTFVDRTGAELIALAVATLVFVLLAIYLRNASALQQQLASLRGTVPSVPHSR